LKQARLAKGVSLRQIEASTKISVGALEALEKDDYARLPGGIFARSFVRAYAGAVGLNPDDTVHEFLTEFEKFERDNERSAKRPEITPDDLEFLERQRRALRTLRVVLVLVAVVAIAAIVYFALVWWPARGAQV
jgi:cytoskeletal protein RodZ